MLSPSASAEETRIESDRVVALIKFFDRPEYAESFLRGELYMDTLKHFRERERNDPRGDRREAQGIWLPQGCVLKCELNGKYETFPGITELAYTRDVDLSVNIFCMYALRTSAAAEKSIPTRTAEWGDTYVILIDGDEFLRRVEVAAQKTEQSLEKDIVTYMDRQIYFGRVGIFKKSIEFSWQSEYRIALRPGHSGEAYKLNVSDLRDITMIGPTDDLNRRIRLVPDLS